MMMNNRIVASGVVHRIPHDLKKMLLSSSSALRTWQSVTPLARNEWICWIVSAKKIETRSARLRRACEELEKGKRRPCCWAGCIHRL